MLLQLLHHAVGTRRLCVFGLLLSFRAVGVNSSAALTMDSKLDAEEIIMCSKLERVRFDVRFTVDVDFSRSGVASCLMLTVTYGFIRRIASKMTARLDDAGSEALLVARTATPCDEHCLKRSRREVVQNAMCYLVALASYESEKHARAGGEKHICCEGLKKAGKLKSRTEH